MIETATYLLVIFGVIALFCIGITLYSLNERFDSHRFLVLRKMNELEHDIQNLKMRVNKTDILVSSTTSFSESTRENLDLLTTELGYKVVNKGKQIEKVVNEI
jgi:hypothetical protein